MSRRKNKIVTAVTTFSVALGIGFVMQYGDAVAARLAPSSSNAAKTIDPINVKMPQEANIAASLAMPSAAPPLDIPVPVQLAALGDAANAFAVPDLTPQAVIPTPACEVTMDAVALPLAMVSLSVAASCLPETPVTIHHQGMMFTVLTDKDGIAAVLVPALAKDAFFLSSFPDGEGAVTSVPVPELVNFDRAVLQWQGVSAVQLHALEYGADYGTDGHIWSASAGTLDLVNPPQDGFLIRLGDDTRDIPLMAEVYTYPSGTASRDGTVALSVEAEVTQANCGQAIEAQSIQIDPTSEPTAIDLTMTMPDCDAIGEFLLLKNMFKDLTLAAK